MVEFRVFRLFVLSPDCWQPLLFYSSHVVHYKPLSDSNQARWAWTMAQSLVRNVILLEPIKLTWEVKNHTNKEMNCCVPVALRPFELSTATVLYDYTHNPFKIYWYQLTQLCHWLKTEWLKNAHGSLKWSIFRHSKNLHSTQLKISCACTTLHTTRITSKIKAQQLCLTRAPHIIYFTQTIS